MMDPPMQPVLEDARVILRPTAAEDRDALFNVASDPQIWALHPAHDRWKAEVFDPFFAEGLASNGGLIIVDKTNDMVIGSSRYDIRVCEPGEVEIGWTYLARSTWGGEINRSIKRMMIAYAFERGFEAVIFLVGENNLRSRRAMEKIGAVLTDRRQEWPMADTVVDHLIYRITPEVFACGPLSRP